MGCTRGAIDRFAYPESPGEVQLLRCRTALLVDLFDGQAIAKGGRVMLDGAVRVILPGIM